MAPLTLLIVGGGFTSTRFCLRAEVTPTPTALSNEIAPFCPYPLSSRSANPGGWRARALGTLTSPTSRGGATRVGEARCSLTKHYHITIERYYLHDQYTC